MSQFTLPIVGNKNNKNGFVPSTAATGALSRLRAIFAHEGVHWTVPVNAQDQSMLGLIAHRIDNYLFRDDYAAGCSYGHQLLIMGDIMKRGARNIGAQAQWRQSWSARINGFSFFEYALERHVASRHQEHVFAQEARENALDEARLREANQCAATVEQMLGQMDIDDNINEDFDEAMQDAE